MTKVKNELKRFLIVGVGSVSIDLCSYIFLINFVLKDWAKALSFFLGTCFAFLLNKYWTFRKNERSYRQLSFFILLYTTTLGVNVWINKLILDYSEIVILSFFVATSASTVLNFLGQKWWVFR